MSNVKNLIDALNKAVAAAEPPSQARVCGKCPAWTDTVFGPPYRELRPVEGSLRRVGLAGTSPCGPGYSLDLQLADSERSFLSLPATTPMSSNSKLYAKCIYGIINGQIMSKLGSAWFDGVPVENDMCVQPPSFNFESCWLEVPARAVLDNPTEVVKTRPPTAP